MKYCFDSSKHAKRDVVSGICSGADTPMHRKRSFKGMYLNHVNQYLSTTESWSLSDILNSTFETVLTMHVASSG